MRKFKMKEKYFRIYIVPGVMLLIVGLLSVINDNVISLIINGGNIVKIILPIIIVVLGISVIVKSLKCRVETNDEMVVYYSGISPGKSIRYKEIDYIFMEHKNKFIIHSVNNKKFTINYIFDDLAKFNKILRSHNVKIERGY